MLHSLPSLGFLLLAGQWISSATAAAPYCLPGDSCYPSTSAWSKFNATVGGKLIKIEPYGAPCYAASYDADKCLDLVKRKKTFDFRHTEPAALMYTNWEQTDDLRGCPLPDLPSDNSAPPPIKHECTLGAMSDYMVNATTVDDIVASVKWSAKYNLRFRIKNTGHCYTGRSSGEGSFAVWTAHMNDAKVDKQFVPYGTRQTPQVAISAGPAVNVEGLYRFGSANGLVTIGGFTQSVGATGGYILGGGTGPLSPHFGLGVDNVLQFEVIGADGSRQIANNKLNSSLFWALRGGGGTFGVVTRVWLKAYPAFKVVNTVSGVVGCEDASTYKTLVGAMMDLQIPSRDANQTGIWETDPATNSLSLVSFETFRAQVKPDAETLAIWNPLMNVKGCKPQFRSAQFSGPGSWFAAYQDILPLINAGGIVGVNLADLSRLISNKLIHDPKGRDKIEQFIVNSPVPTIIQNVVGGATNHVAHDATAVHPAWRDVFSFMDSPVFGPWQGISAAQNATVEAVSKNLTEVFGRAVYYNEQHPTDIDFQSVQWGSNYPRLLSIKRSVDPNGVFSCRNCVGSEPGF